MRERMRGRGVEVGISAIKTFTLRGVWTGKIYLEEVLTGALVHMKPKNSDLRQYQKPKNALKRGIGHKYYILVINIDQNSGYSKLHL